MCPTALPRMHAEGRECHFVPFRARCLTHAHARRGGCWCRGAIKDREQGVEEIVLAEKIIAHLIKREQVLLVVEQPARAEGESAADYGKRLQNERVLALNPNYSAE